MDQSPAKSLGSIRLIALMTGVPFSLSITILAPILPKMEAALAHTPNEAMLVKMALAINGIAQVMGAPIAGYLADRMGRGMLMVWSLLVWALVGVAAYFIDNLMLMVVTRFIVAAAAASALTVSLAMIADIPDNDARNKLMGFNIALMSVTGVITMPLSGVLGDIDWRMPFLMYLVGLVLTVVVFLAVKKDPTLTTSPPKASTTEQTAFNWPVGLMFLGLFLGITQLSPSTYMPFALRELGVTSATVIGSTITAMTITMASASAVYGYARPYMSANVMLAVALTLSTIGMGIIATATSYVPALCGLVIAGMGVGWYSPNLLILAGEAASMATRGRIIGLVKGAQMSASFVAVLMLEPIWRAAGPKGIFAALTAMAALGAAYFYVRVYISRRQATPNAS